MMEIDGISFALCIGRPILIPKVELTKTHFRLVLGPIALWIMFLDLEVKFSEMNTIINKYESSLPVVREALALRNSGYDGPFLGESVSPLFSAISKMEQIEKS